MAKKKNNKNTAKKSKKNKCKTLHFDKKSDFFWIEQTTTVKFY